MRMKILNDIRAEDAILSGDGLCDTPGHTAKYLCYYLLDHVKNLVIDVEIVDKTQTQGKSSIMERFALDKSLVSLQDTINIVEVVTDASSTIKKMIADIFNDIFHSLDISHKAKSIRKSIAKISKTKAMKKIHMWSNEIINHFWHCCEITSQQSDLKCT
ncbi:hypothetical protein QZH41_020354 [Actinostola sp. cb2023]|nr:hypothetical protein QZH41_020354 [Actinostola sp. cb2023]